MKQFFIQTSLSILLLFSLPLSAFEEIGKVSAPLPEMAKPGYTKFSNRFFYHDNMSGADDTKDLYIDSSRQPNGSIKFTDNDGCSWIRSDRFAPSDSWENCRSKGAQNITRKGDIWPLKLKRKFTYSVKNGRSSNGNTWSDYH